MAQGEKRFSFSGREVNKFQFEPVPPGDWDLKLNATKAEIKKKKGEPNAVPYINVSFTAIGSGGESGRDRLVFHMFFLKLTPNESGRVTVDNENQLGGFVKAGALEDSFQPRTMTVTDEKGNEVEILNPNDVLQFLQDNDGITVRAHTRLRARTDETGKKTGDEATIARFEPAPEQEQYTSSPDGEEEYEEQEEEELPPPPPPKKAAVHQLKKPAAGKRR